MVIYANGIMQLNDNYRDYDRTVTNLLKEIASKITEIEEHCPEKGLALKAMSNALSYFYNYGIGDMKYSALGGYLKALVSVARTLEKEEPEEIRCSGRKFFRIRLAQDWRIDTTRFVVFTVSTMIKFKEVRADIYMSNKSDKIIAIIRGYSEFDSLSSTLEEVLESGRLGPIEVERCQITGMKMYVEGTIPFYKICFGCLDTDGSGG